MQYTNVTDGRIDRHQATAKTALTHRLAVKTITRRLVTADRSRVLAFVSIFGQGWGVV